MSDSSSLSFSEALQTVADNTAENARQILEEQAPGLLRTRDFVVASNVVLVQRICTEFFGEVLPPEKLAKLDSATMLEIQSRVKPFMLVVFDERILEKALGYRR